jgi:hypothetical protein
MMNKKIGVLAAATGMAIFAISQAQASQMMVGKPGGATAKGNVAVSAEYAFSHDAEYKRVLQWNDPDADYDVSSSAASLKVTYGIADNVSLSAHYGRLRSVDVDRYNDSGTLRYVGDGGDGDRWGVGADVGLYKNNNLTVGINAMWSRVSFDSPTTEVGQAFSGDKEKVELDQWRMALGIGYNVNADLTVYGGVLANFVSGDTYIAFGNGNMSARNPVEEDATAGFYGGVAYNFGNFLVGVEAQRAFGDTQFAGTFGYKF